MLSWTNPMERSYVLNSLGIPAYGIFPMFLPDEEHMRMHGLNERLSIASLEEGLNATCETVRSLASYAPPG